MEAGGELLHATHYMLPAPQEPLDRILWVGMWLETLNVGGTEL